MESRKRATSESGVAPRVPGHGGQRLAEIEPDLGDPVHDHGELFHQPHAGGAVDPFEVELDGLEPRRQRPAVAVGETRGRRTPQKSRP